jgi:hypothetical protein
LEMKSCTGFSRNSRQPQIRIGGVGPANPKPRPG